MPNPSEAPKLIQVRFSACDFLCLCHAALLEMSSRSIYLYCIFLVKEVST